MWCGVVFMLTCHRTIIMFMLAFHVLLFCVLYPMLIENITPAFYSSCQSSVCRFSLASQAFRVFVNQATNRYMYVCLIIWNCWLLVYSLYNVFISCIAQNSRNHIYLVILTNQPSHLIHSSIEIVCPKTSPAHHTAIIYPCSNQNCRNIKSVSVCFIKKFFFLVFVFSRKFFNNSVRCSCY